VEGVLLAESNDAANQDRGQADVSEVNDRDALDKYRDKMDHLTDDALDAMAKELEASEADREQLREKLAKQERLYAELLTEANRIAATSSTAKADKRHHKGHKHQTFDEQYDYNVHEGQAHISQRYKDAEASHPNHRFAGEIKKIDSILERAAPKDKVRHLAVRAGGKRDESRYAGLSEQEVSSLERMIYAAPHNPAPPLEAARHYLLFDYDSGGMNNIRIGWEMAGIIAQRTNRTLVLPPPTAFYLIKDGGFSKAGDYLDVARLKANVPTLTFDEFVEREKSDLSLPDIASQKHDPMIVYKKWKEWAGNNSNFAVVSGPGNCELNRYVSNNKVLYAASMGNDDRTFSCGDWAAIGQPRFTKDGERWEASLESWGLLRNGFVWHPDVYRDAAKVVAKLGLFEYTSLHARYGDFQFKEKRQPADEVIASLGSLPGGGLSSLLAESEEGSTVHKHKHNHRHHRHAHASLLDLSSGASVSASRGSEAAQHMLPLLKKGSTLYLSTDETDPAFFEAFQEHGIKAVHWGDIERDIQGLTTPERTESIKGIVEQMICAYGKVFVATELSTFSAYAQRMRIYADAPVKTRLYHTKPRTSEEDKAIADELSAWEAKGGANAFKPDDMNLVSLAYIPPSQ
jgi:hypothetical protein